MSADTGARERLWRTLSMITDPSYVGNYSDAEVVGIYRKWARHALAAGVPPDATLVEFLRPGIVWVNDHTGDETTITSFASRVERIPDPAGGFRDDPQLVVHHTVNVPPGFTEGYGDDLRSFLAHWHPAGVGVPPDEVWVGLLVPAPDYPARPERIERVFADEAAATAWQLDGPSPTANSAYRRVERHALAGVGEARPAEPAAECAACAGDPEALDLHVCGKEPFA